jgi:MarR family transcriptional regulator, transcriptional regulator for hemolysin
MSKTSPFKYEKADDSPGFLLWKVTALWQKKLSEVLSELEITQTQYAMLASLKWFEEKGEPTTQSHLVEHTKIDKMTISKAIRKLEVNGLVLRDQSSLDSRATNVRFTPHGKEVILKAVTVIENADEQFFSCLTKKQQETYKLLISKVITNNSQ